MRCMTKPVDEEFVNRITRNRDTVRQMIEEYANYLQPSDGTRVEAAIDEQDGQYKIVRTGSKNGERLDECLVHLAAQDDGKIYVMQNRTELEIDYELMRLGVPLADIVPAARVPVV